jgi:hypothetical protein
MEKIKYNTMILLLAVLITSCGGKHNDPVVNNPTASLLIFPDKDAACIVGTNVSATQSTVSFKWQSAATADSYDITIKDLVSGNTVTKSSAGAQLDVALALNTPYSWFVTSKVNGNNNTVKSDTWRFYNSGPGVSTYAPFPAEIVSPTIEQKINAVSGNVTLSWSGKDIDNDIVDYDVYLGTSVIPALLKANVNDSKLAVPVTSKKTYYWKIITRDSKNNTSDSGVFQFSVN